MKLQNLIIISLVLLMSCKRPVDNEPKDIPVEIILPSKTDIIEPGKGIDQITIGQNIKLIIKQVGAPTEVFSRQESKLDSIFHPVRDTSFFLPYYFDFDTAYHFRNINKYGLAHVYSKNGKALVLSFSYMFSESITPMVNGKIMYFDKTEEVKQAFTQQPIHIRPQDDPLLKEFGIKEDKFEDLYYFEQGIQFDIYNGEMTSFTIFSLTNLKDFNKLIDQIKQK
jgi:hypothetical protein